LVLAEADYALADYRGAATAANAAAKDNAGDKEFGAQRVQLRLAVWEALALTREGHAEEAARLLAPLLVQERGYYARNREDESERLDYATLLYAQALVDRGHHDALLAQARGIIGALPPEMQSWLSVRRWRDRVLGEIASPARAVLDTVHAPAG
jgi:hypothetical protein